MLPGGTDPLYRSILRTSAHPYTRLEVWSQGVRVDDYGPDGVPFFTGNLSATLTSQVTRQLSFTTHENLYPDIGGLLAPDGNEIRAFQGVRSGSTVPYEWQTFRGRINNVAMADALNVSCVDRAGDVADANFRVPENSNTTLSVVDEFKRLITNGVIDATFGVSDDIMNATPKLTWEDDRSSACDDLADSSGAFWYALANGDFVMRFIPWTTALGPVLDLSDGEGGEILYAEPSRSRDGVANIVTVVGERADGTTPVFATAQDLDPASTTYINGPYGIKGKLVKVQTATTPGQAAAIARAQLRTSKALFESWSMQVPADASLELGDVLRLNARGKTAIQVVQSFTLPLDNNEMTVQMRAQVPGTADIVEL